MPMSAGGASTTAPAGPLSPNLLTRVALEHVPATHAVHAALFRDVRNAAALHAQLLARNPAFEYAFVDASAVASTAQVLAAAFRAIVASLSAGGGGLRTANVHSETVFCLSPSNNITEAYRRYGISPATKDVIVVKILAPPPAAPAPDSQAQPSPETKTQTAESSSDKPASGAAAAATPLTAEDVWTHLSANVEGTAVPFTDENVALCTDWAKVRKYYKLNGAAALAGVKDEATRRRESEMLILGAMALRGI